MQPVKKFILWFVMITMAISSVASLVHADENLTVESLNQGLSNIKKRMQSSQSRAEKLQILERFHQALRTEIRGRADAGVRDAVYWRAVDLDVATVKMIDQSCVDLKKSLETAEFNRIDNDDSKISDETQQTIDVANAVCP